MSENVAYISQKDTAPWQLAGHGDQDGKPVYVKELIYTGKFRMANGVEFEVDRGTLDHWASTHASLSENGIQVPLPIEHSDDPEKTRGHIVGMYVENNSRGIPALFGKVQFRDPQAAELAKTAQVSIFSPPEFIDGKGNHYVRPIKHVALTDYPVIPSLQGFQSIAASFVSPKEAIMPLKELATKLALSCEDETKLEDTIIASFKAKDELVSQKDTEIEALKKRIPADPISVSAAHRNMLKDNRDMKLSLLVSKGHISPAVKDELVKAFCSDDTLTLALSREGSFDPFDAVVLALSKNVIVELGEADTIVLSNRQAADNPLIADAKKRSEAAKVK